MIRDPFYRKIISRLNSDLDPYLFEECSVDLIRNDFPTIVPVKGGSDAGMDGAISDLEGRAFPLIATTGKDVIGNLTRNLKSYLRNKGSRRKAILATSQNLTQRKRNNLETRAEELGFTLIQIYDQNALARRLYQSPKWCVELLGLTGEPPALSVIPLSKRPLIEHDLIGRDEDFEWLKKTEGDKLLVGQPGSGKTFLLYKFALKGYGLFVVNDDLGFIAKSIRSEKPKALIVDDAHINTNLLVALSQLRKELKVSFSIIATCWPGYKSKISEALNLPSSQLRDLLLLDRDKIVEVIRQSGIGGPVELVRDLVDQAQGRPGLAVTLTFLCLRGDIQSVALGDALCRSIITTFQPIIGDDATVILASLAIGGESGMTMKAVAKALEIPVIHVQKIVTMLASGGVVREISQDRLAVTPAQLRFALLRDVFFQGATSLDPQNLIENSSDYDNTLITLIGAKARGAIISNDWLLSLIGKSDSSAVWETYAWSGKDEAKIAIKIHPEFIISLSHPTLFRIPDIIIPQLLEKSMGDHRPLNSATDHPLRLIEDWIKSAVPGTGQVVERRKCLLQAIINWLGDGGDTEIAQQALKYVFSLDFERTSIDPGAGRTVTFTHGCILHSELQEIINLWPSVFKVIQGIQNLNWACLFKIIENAIHIWHVHGEVPKNFIELSHQLAREIIQDIVVFAEGHPAVIQKLKRLSKQLNSELKVLIDKEFEILYPSRDVNDWESARAKQRIEVEKLANTWAKEVPKAVVNRLIKYEIDATAVGGGHWPRWSSHLCEIISSKIDIKAPWIRALIDSNCPVDFIQPFLQKAAIKGEKEWINFAAECLENSNLRFVTISIVLTLPSPPKELLEKVLSSLEDYGSLIETLCLRKEIPDDTLIKLLSHPNIAVSSKASIGVWLADPKGQIEERISKEWKIAIIKIMNDDYWLSEILQNDHLLAFDWLKIHINDSPDNHYTFNKICEAAIKVLNFQQRCDLLDILSEDFFDWDIASYIIGNDIALYKRLLSKESHKDIHLLPLTIDIKQEFDEAWIEKAKAAIEAGYTPEDIADSARGHSWSWSGNISEMWKKWVVLFSILCENEDRQIQKIGEIGKASAKAELDRAIEEENREAVYGRR